MSFDGAEDDTMNDSPRADKIPYAQLRKDFLEHPVRYAEVPGEHAISLPVPTLRWSMPAYAVFAGPAVRAPGRPLGLGAPDRWWALHARSGRLVGYGLNAAVPFAPALGPDHVSVERGGRSIARLTEELRLLDELMDAAAGPFFDGSAIATAVRSDLREVLAAAVTPDTLPWYRALAPDFLPWLESGT